MPRPDPHQEPELTEADRKLAMALAKVLHRLLKDSSKKPTKLRTAA